MQLKKTFLFLCIVAYQQTLLGMFARQYMKPLSHIIRRFCSAEELIATAEKEHNKMHDLRQQLQKVKQCACPQEKRTSTMELALKIIFQKLTLQKVVKELRAKLASTTQKSANRSQRSTN